MSAIKFSLVAIAVIAAASCAQAAGGIKGRPQQAVESQRAQGAIKGPALRPPQQQQFLPPPPPPAPIQQAIKAGPGQVAPAFTAARIQPAVVQQQQLQQEQEPIVQQQQQEAEPASQQQQVQVQQQEEVDPNAAAQDNAPSVAAPARAAASEEEANPRPEPYAFQYAFDSGDSATSGSSQREEQQDANGRVTGFYTLRGEDGRDRRVDYVADASGFRATISTNELGTAAKDSADVDWNAQNPSEAQLRAAESATQAARQRALLAPQQQQQQQQQAQASSGSSSLSKLSSPRSKVSQAAQQQQQQQQQYNDASSNQQQQQQEIAQQLQEPFEQIRQTELNARARKSRHAPFYLYTV